MNSKSHSDISHLFTISFILLASLNLFVGQATAQRLPNAEELGKTYRGILFRCLQKKWPDIQIDYSHPDRAYIPETQQNVAWDNEKKAWIDTKTGK